MLLLDLFAEDTEVWRMTNSFYGKPFIWCMLHNFGGNRALYGNLTTIAVKPLEALAYPGTSMVRMT